MNVIRSAEIYGFELHYRDTVEQPNGDMVHIYVGNRGVNRRRVWRTIARTAQNYMPDVQVDASGRYMLIETVDDWVVIDCARNHSIQLQYSEYAKISAIAFNQDMMDIVLDYEYFDRRIDDRDIKHSIPLEDFGNVKDKWTNVLTTEEVKAHIEDQLIAAGHLDPRGKPITHLLIRIGRILLLLALLYYSFLAALSFRESFRSKGFTYAANYSIPGEVTIETYDQTRTHCTLTYQIDEPRLRVDLDSYVIPIEYCDDFAAGRTVGIRIANNQFTRPMHALEIQLRQYVNTFEDWVVTLIIVIIWFLCWFFVALITLMVRVNLEDIKRSQLPNTNP